MENKVLIATRVKGKGDTWVHSPNLIIKDEILYNSLTECLEAYYQITGIRCDFVLSPIKGEIYILSEDNKQPPIKKFSLYDE